MIFKKKKQKSVDDKMVDTLKEKFEMLTKSTVDLQEATVALQEQADEVTKQIQQAASEEFTKRIFEFSNLLTDAIIITKNDGEIIFVNEPAENLFGWKRDELVGSNISKILSRKTTKKHTEYVACQKSKKTHNSIFIGNRSRAYGVKRNEEHFPIELSLSYTKRDDEKSFVICLVRDLTEQNKIQKAMKEAKDQLQEIINTIPSMIFYKDTQNRFVLVNKAAAEEAGISAEDFRGRTAWEIFGKELGDHYYEHDKQIIETKQPMFNVNEYSVTEDGIRYFTANKIPMFNKFNEVENILIVSTDITEIKETQEELEKAYNYQKTIFNTNPAIIYTKDKDFRFVDVNANFEQFIGLSKEEVVNKTTEDLNNEHNITISSIPSHKSYLYSKELRVTDAQLRNAHTGQVYDGILYEKSLWRKDEPIGILGTFIDLTEKRKVENALKKKEKILRVVANSGQRFLLEFTKETILEVLQDLCLAIDAERAYLSLSNCYYNLDEKSYCWSKENYSDYCEKTFDFSQFKKYLNSWFKDLLENKIINKKTLETDYIDELSACGIKAVLIVPILIDDKLIGYLGFDECNQDRSFSESEVDAVRAAAGAFGAALRKEKFIYDLRTVNAKQKDYADLSSDWELDSNLLFKYVSGMVFNVIGLKPEDMLGKSFGDLRIAKDSELEELNNQLSKHKKIKNYKIETGTERKAYLLINAKPLHDENGNFVGYRGTSTDVTDEVLSGQALQESELIHRSFLDNALNGMYIIENEKVILINNRMLEILGYNDKSKILNRNFVEFLHPDYAQKVLQRHRDRLKGQAPAKEIYEAKVIHKNGYPVDLEISISLVNVGNRQLTTVTAVDITEKKQREEKIAKEHEKVVAREARFRALLRNSYDAILVLDSVGNHLYTSPAVKRVLKRNPQDLYHSNVFEYVHPDDHKRIQNVLNEVTSEENKMKSTVLRVRTGDEQWNWVEIIVTNLLHETHVEGLVVNMHNINLQMQMQNKSKLFNIITDNCDNPVIVTDKVGNIIYLNNSFINYYGHDKIDLLGNNPKIEQLSKLDSKLYQSLWNAINNKGDSDVISVLHSQTNEPIYYVAIKK